jgi:two-component system NarL family response regulator
MHIAMPPPIPVRVLIADDHPLMLDGIARSLLAQGGIDVVALARNGKEAVELFARRRPDVCLLDLQMPDHDGFEALRGIRALQPDARLIVLTTYGGDARIQAALDAGAAAYLLKDALGEELANAVRRVHQGAHVFGPQARADMHGHYAADRLSPRELDVLQLVAGGHTNRTIGDMLGISEPTVKSHMSTILVKLGANDRTHAVTLAARRGYLSV